MNKPQKKNSASNLVTRAVTGAIYVTVIVLACLFGETTMLIVFGILGLAALLEFTSLFKDSEFAPDKIVTSIYGMILYVLGYQLMQEFYQSGVSNSLLILIFALIAMPMVLGLSQFFQQKKHAIINTALAAFAIFYIVPSFILVNVMSATIPGKVSVFPVLAIFIMTWTADTFAYLIGRKWGKHKMIESISPNKSWEGFFAGLIFAIISGIIIAHFTEDANYLPYSILAIIVTIFGFLGDLFESMIKRSLNLKDSGSILPGHGGILDRIDSLLFAIPAGFIFYILFMLFLP